jgi:hypothetical protein
MFSHRGLTRRGGVVISVVFAGRRDRARTPGVTVRDPLGREWHVKQPPRGNQGAEVVDAYAGLLAILMLFDSSDRQWAEAFRAGGYDPAVADRFIRRIPERIEAGLRLPSQVG